METNRPVVTLFNMGDNTEKLDRLKELCWRD